MERVLYLEPDEEITSVIDRIKSLKSKTIALVVPRDAVILQSMVNLKLLKKEADKLDRKLSIVTADKVGRNLASQVGLAVYDKLEKEFLEPEPEEEWQAVSSDETLEDLEKSSAKSLQKAEELEKEPAKIEKPEEPIKSSPEKEISGKEKGGPSKSFEKAFEPPQKGKFKLNKKLLIIGIIFSIFALAFILFLFLPKAQINLVVKAEKIESDFDLSVDKSIIDPNLTESLIPGQIIEAEAEKESTANATGKKEVGEKARGTVRVYNSYDSDPQAIKAGTKFTKDAKVFTNAATVTVPGFTLEAGNPVPGTAEVVIVAEREGEAYNIAAGKFSIAGFPVANFYAQSSQAMSGGYSKTVTVISQGDIDGLKNTLTEGATVEAKKSLSSENGDDLEYLEDGLALEVINFATSHQVDEQFSDFTGKIKIKVRAIAYKKADFEKIVNENFQKEATAKGKELAEVDFQNMKKTIKSKDFGKGTMMIAISGEGFAGPKLDEKKLKLNLIRKDRIRGVEYLTSFAEIKSAEVNLWPFWVKKVPALERSIKIKIEYRAVEDSNQTEE